VHSLNPGRVPVAGRISRGFPELRAGSYRTLGALVVSTMALLESTFFHKISTIDATHEPAVVCVDERRRADDPFPEKRKRG
jgi:hypothetical protein